MRYLVTVKRGKKNEQKFIDYSIGNGVIISTSIGSSGYFSYPQRMISEKVSRDFKFDSNKIGICHINPDFLERKVVDSIVRRV
jgi:NAD+ kinase